MAFCFVLWLVINRKSAFPTDGVSSLFAFNHGDRLFHALVASHVVELRHARKPLAARLAVLARQNGDGRGSVREIAPFVPIDVIGGCHCLFSWFKAPRL